MYLVVALLIAGAILRWADNPAWFSGAHTVGLIVFIAGVALLAFILIMALLAGSAYRAVHRRFFR